MVPTLKTKRDNVSTSNSFQCVYCRHACFNAKCLEYFILMLTHSICLSVDIDECAHTYAVYLCKLSLHFAFAIICVHLSRMQGVFVCVCMWDCVRVCMHCRHPGKFGSLLLGQGRRWRGKETRIQFQAGWGYKRAETTLHRQKDRQTHRLTDRQSSE